jgi:hypothetical protein
VDAVAHNYNPDWEEEVMKIQAQDQTEQNPVQTRSQPVNVGCCGTWQSLPVMQEV